MRIDQLKATEINLIKSLLGNTADRQIAERFGLSVRVVCNFRNSQGIAAYHKQGYKVQRISPQKEEAVAKVAGTAPDPVIARHFGINSGQVFHLRQRRNIAAYRHLDAYVELTCDLCGKKFQKKRSAMKRNNRNYCSKEHADSGNRKGGAKYGHHYGSDWEGQKAAARARDVVCQLCFKTKELEGKNLHVHHKIPFRFGGSNALHNLVTLCASCHMKVEQATERALEQHVRLAISLQAGTFSFSLNGAVKENIALRP